MHYFADPDIWEAGFRPRTPAQFFALQLARRLDDVGNLSRYAQLVELYREDQIIRAMHGLRYGRGLGLAAIERLEAELSKSSNRTSYE